MIPIHVDLKKSAGLTAVLCTLIYAFMAVVVGIPAHLMPLKIGLTLSLVGIFWLYFEKVGWRHRVFRFKGWFCDLPDLNGRWEGTINRLGENDPHPFVLEIRQSYLRVQLHAYTQNSHGSSITAQFVTDQVHGKYSLISTWQCMTKNRTNPDKIDEFLGTSVYDIAVSPTKRVLEDYYFTRRDPQTKGRTTLTFVSEQLSDGL